MYAVLLAALQAAFTWALPRILAIGTTAILSETISQPLLTWIHGQINTKLSGLSAITSNFLTFTGIPEAITILFSAYAAVLSIKAAKAAFAAKSSTPNV
jgi:hypothetical protein